MPPRTIGPFQLERQIGVGGMGIVYSAIYPKNGKRVAVKVLSPGMMSDPKLLKRFEREIEILKRLDHPNIVKYYGGGTESNQRYYAMEYLDGGSLQDVLKKRKRLNWEQTIHVGRQITAALEHAHNAGIIHRDLKPANLFLTKKGRLKLGDFGIARDTEATALTAAGKTVGTYAYMAPEQIQVSHPISRKTDLYAVGCLLYEVIVGETPFVSENPMDMLMQHLKDDPYSVSEKVPDCPPQLNQLIERLLEKNPDDRPYDALAVHTELGEIRDAIKAADEEGLDLTSAGAALPPRAGRKKGEEQAAVTDDGTKKKKKKKKKRKDVPIHERTWFLATCLLALLAATIWLLMPPGEDWYADEWRESIRGDEYAQRATLEDHIDPYLAKFPDGKHVAEANDLSNLIHANMLELQLKNLARRSDVIEPPFKAACVNAARLEDEEGLIYKPTWDEQPDSPLPSNPLPALQRWKQLAERGRQLMTSTPTAAPESDEEEPAASEDETKHSEADEIRWLTRLCENHHEYFRARLLSSPRSREFLQERLLDAESLADDDLTLNDAKAIWRYVQAEFAKVDRLQDYAEYAQQRLQGQTAELPPS